MPATILRLDKPAIFSIENFGGLQKIADIDEKNCIVKTVLMQLSAISRNRTFYSGEDFVRCLTTSAYVNEQLSQGVWFGELEHPEKNCTQDRFFKIDDTRISHKILDYKVNGDIIDGHVQFVAPMGYIPWDWIQKNSNIAFSVRVFTPNFLEKKDEKGVAYIAKVGDMIPITFDCVKMPGFAIARIADPSKFAQVNTAAAMPSAESLQYEKGWESKEIIFPRMDWRAKMSQEEFRHILSKESTMKILEDVYKFDASKSKITYNDNETVTISLNSTESLNLGVNTYELLKVQNAKYKQTGKNYNSDPEDPWSREAYEEFDINYDITNDERLEAMSMEGWNSFTLDEYEKKLKPIIKNQLLIIKQNFEKCLRMAFDRNLNKIPQNIIDKHDKNEVEKCWQLFKKHYHLQDSNKIMNDIDCYAKKENSFQLPNKGNGKYILLVEVDSLNNDEMRKLKTVEETIQKKAVGLNLILTGLLSVLTMGMYAPAFVIYLYLFLTLKERKGVHLSQLISQFLNHKKTSLYLQVKQTMSFNIWKQQQIYLKMNFKIRK